MSGVILPPGGVRQTDRQTCWIKNCLVLVALPQSADMCVLIRQLYSSCIKPFCPMHTLSTQSAVW